ncbi:ABC transporter substrate-binding protein [Desulfohalovibrio reitneri]|uniref:ABC transporter substrate-binding protein n=1 Tax=Desulfohalovibrio reitneri TaxID=1307759 RepID=UPI0004A75319|nr:ABC transporter substrate-binding protein [Desulfohalovibrio reitneri]
MRFPPLLILLLFLLAVPHPANAQQRATISMGSGAFGLPLTSAQQIGAFKQNGIDLEISHHGKGAKAMAEFLAKGYDFGWTSGLPITKAAFDHDGFCLLASLGSTGKLFEVWADRGKGITTVGDLRGKRIGVTGRGRGSDYYLYALLLKNGIEISEVEVVPMKRKELPAALSKSEVDAVSEQPSRMREASEVLGGDLVVFADDTVFLRHVFLLARKDFVRANPDLAVAMLRSLDQGIQHLRDNPGRAVDFISAKLDLDPRKVRELMEDTDYRLSLDQSLYPTMENYAQWLIQTGVVKRGPLPDFTNIFCPDPLMSIDPGRVTIIH